MNQKSGGRRPLIGLCLQGGLVAGAFEAAIFVFERPIRDRSERLLVAAALVCAVPLAWTAAVAGLAAVRRVWLSFTCRMGIPLPIAEALLAAACLWPFLASLSSGRWVSSLPGAPAYPWVTCLLGGIAWAATWHRLPLAEDRNPRWRALIAAASLAAWGGLYLGDRSLYPGLYPAGHLLLALFACATATAAGVAWIAPWFRDTRRIASAALFLAFGLGTSGPMLWRRPATVQAVLENTSAGAQIGGRLIALGFRPGGIRPLDLAGFARIATAFPLRAGRGLEARRDPLPAVVIVTLEATRADHLGFLGYDRCTSPNLDRFAAECVLAPNGWCAANSSHEALVALFGARYPDGEGGEVERVFAPLRSQRVRSVAYFASGNMLQHADLFGPFDEVRPYVQRGLEIVGAVGCELEAARGQRLLLWIHLFDPHAPYDPLPEDRIFGDRPIDLYDAEIRAMDRAFGALLELIDAQLGRERCVVAVTSDHGEAFGEHGVWYHKSGLHEEQVRVPLLVRAPGLRPHRVQRPVSHVDLLPTVFELAGWPLPANDGLSLLEVHAGGERPVFCRHEDCALAVRRGRWKLMADFGTGARRLFDLRSDPREREDVAHRHADVVQDLDDLLLAFDGGRGGHLGRTFGETAVLSMAGTLASTGQGPVRAFARHVLSLRR